MPWILNSNPDSVILELGVNDGLRGLSVEQTRTNLDQIIHRLRQAGVRVVLAGMKLPPNYGKEYTAGFEAIYPRWLNSTGYRSFRSFSKGWRPPPTLNQPDGIHPRREGYRIIVEQVLKTMRPLLDERQTTSK